MINNRAVNEGKKLSSRQSRIFTPAEGHSYAHHASLAFFKGCFYAMWSCGIVHEDDPGQSIMISRSRDAIAWETPSFLATPDMLGDDMLVLTAGGFYVYEDTLKAYFGQYRYTEESLEGDRTRVGKKAVQENTGLWVISTRDGQNWDAPRQLNIALAPNHGPHPTHSGRLIFPGNVMFAYTDDRAGESNIIPAGIYGDAFGNELPMDSSGHVRRVTDFRGWNAPLICEGSFFQTDDGVIHMMLRSNSDRLWCSESRDDGETWSEPFPTDYSDDGSKHHFGRLPDGRFYGVNNAVWNRVRNPLDLYLSRDGENFDEHFIIRDEERQKLFEGCGKRGVYGYPHTLIHENNLYVIYSVNKEAIEVSIIPLHQL